MVLVKLLGGLDESPRYVFSAEETGAEVVA
jgi:hypothetical protein